MTTNATLCIIKKDNKILLQLKTEGRFGEGKWNGSGGKINPGELPHEAVVREVEEETGLKVRDLKLHGVLRHHFEAEEEKIWKVYVYSTSIFNGTIQSSPEGELKWFHIEDIPYDKMWLDDIYWLPLLLEDREFAGDFYFNEDGSILLGHQLVVINKVISDDFDDFEE